MANKPNPTHTRRIMGFFEENGATDYASALPMNQILLFVSDPVTRYYLDKLIEDQYIRRTNQGDYWFDARQWEKDVRHVLRQYYLILIGPIVLGIIGYFVLNAILK